MLSIDFIRENKQKVADAAKNKNREVDLDAVLTLDEERRAKITEIRNLREERNSISGKSVGEDVIARARAIKEELRSLEETLRDIEERLKVEMYKIPNVPLDEVPVGKDESGNRELRTWGTPPTFDFTPKSHIDLVESLDLADLTRGTKVSGFRGYFLKNQGAILHFAILFYVFQKLVSKGYTPLIAPSLVKGFTFFGNGQFPWGKQEVYQVEEDTYLSGTAEVPVTSYFSDELLEERDLPKKFVAFSPCFRKEAGSYGKDTKGLYRLHEFWKVEQVIVAPANVDVAISLHEELQSNCEEILQELELAYRVMLMCTGDMGEPQIKKYDTEAWMPSRESYGEVTSNSILGDFQARRLNMRYRETGGDKKYCYTLNNTAIASPRILIALLENHQTGEGHVRVPKILHHLTGFDTIKP